MIVSIASLPFKAESLTLEGCLEIWVMVINHHRAEILENL